MKRTYLPLLVAVVAVLTGACASSSPPASQTDPSRDLAEMKERILELQEQAAVTEVEMERLRSQVAELERRLVAEGVERPLAALQTTPPPPSPPASEATRPSTLEPAIEESDLAPEPAVGGAISVPAAAEPSTPSSTPPMTAEESAGPAAMQPVEPAAQALYDRGYTLYHQGKYLDAEASFQRFLQAYPMTELSDNAQFWIGESRFARGDTRGALAAFREVLQKYPEANKVPDALIKEGDCLEKLGDRDGARDRYSEVKRRFPESGAAVMADDRLASLDG
jgi:tol-pal system protein YbgF